MATVPTYGGRQVALSSDSNAQFTPGPAINDSNAQLLRGAQALGQTGSQLSQIGVDMMQQVNQVRVDDAMNKTRKQILDDTYNPQTGYTNLKGDAALTRPNGQSLSQEYGSKLQTKIDELSLGLGNDAQRMAYKRQADQLMTQYQGNIEQHTLKEYRDFSLSTQDGALTIAKNQAQLAWNNPDQINESVGSAKAAVYRMGSLQGWSGNETTAKMLTATSAIHSGVIEAALENGNPDYAFGYMEKNKAEMTSDDMLKVRGRINQDIAARASEAIASGVMTGARLRAYPSDYARMVKITAETESGNNPDAVGPEVKGQGTAKGSMQVMDATAANPGFGVAPAKDDSKEERARVGQQLLTSLVKHYNGDPAKAWAAYNAGSGNVDKAVAASLKSGKNWMDELAQFQSPDNHQQTVAYVNKNMTALNGGAGAETVTLQDVHDQVRATVAQRYGANPPPGLLKLAITNATQQYEDMVNAKKSMDDQNYTTAMKAVMSNGGKVSALPYSVRSAVPAGKMDDLLNFAERVSKGDNQTNPAVYQLLSNTQVLAKMTDDQFFHMRGELSDSDFKHFSTQRDVARGGGSHSKVEEINLSALNSTLGNRLRTLGLDPTPKDGSDEAGRLGAIKKFLTDGMITRQGVMGKQMSDAEVEKFIDEQFAKSVEFRTSWLGISTGTSKERLLTMKAGDIPSAVRDTLKRDYAAAGVSSPTDAELLSAYWRLKSRKAQ